MSVRFTKLIDRNLTSEEVRLFLESCQTPFEVKKFETFQAIELFEIGIALSFTLKGRLFVIHFYGQARDGFCPFKGELPHDLSFNYSRRKVHSLLGRPIRSSKILVWNRTEIPWDLFDFQTYQLHCEYLRREETIQLVTLMSENSDPKEILIAEDVVPAKESTNTGGMTVQRGQ